MTKTYAGVHATDAVYELAEGIIWDDREQLVRWVDITAGRVLAGTLSDGRIKVVDDISIGQTVGAVALAEDGGLLIVTPRGLATLSPAGELSLGPDLLGARADVRLNDGAVDPHGAFVVGTLSLAQETGEEVLLRVQPDGKVDTLRTGVRLSNGVAFSPDGQLIYHVDTFAGTVSSHSYGAGSFDASEPWVTALDDFPASPDGLTVDAHGNLWVAQWGGGDVRQYAPTGQLLGVVVVDAARATCPGFIGAGHTTLGITTAKDDQEGAADRAGALFLAAVDSIGLQENRWAGDTARPYWLREGGR